MYRFIRINVIYNNQIVMTIVFVHKILFTTSVSDDILFSFKLLNNKINRFKQLKCVDFKTITMDLRDKHRNKHYVRL